MDEVPVEVTHRVVEEAGVPVRVISLRGTYGSGSLGNGDAHRMQAAVVSMDALRALKTARPGLSVGHPGTFKRVDAT